ncbi:lytic transglycosylase domain-containing protein [Gordonia sp. (in: high G+C Gram-positive bacteria)]|uniref:lytic transglycosylase domain-containing protein n=1 Tax=Gordonia sp. (in: high G+C Gram-positive bacteria) TaxID=84139 RepID=UPI003C7413F4
MQLNRTTAKSAVLVAGLVPLTGILLSASPSTSHVSAPAPTVVDVVQVKQQAPAPKTASKQTQSALVAHTTIRPEPKSVQSGTVPRINFTAYKSAAETMAKTQPRCGIDWRLIAGIGRVESHHANSGDADKNGRLRTPIFGPVLDGSLSGNQVITDTDGGTLDGDSTYDRAVGPMQFLPSTWKAYAADGNGDGKVDPQNVFDAALTTARYLCDEKLNLKNPGDETRAILRYNNSMEYVNNVLGFARSY